MNIRIKKTKQNKGKQKQTNKQNMWKEKRKKNYYRKKIIKYDEKYEKGGKGERRDYNW